MSVTPSSIISLIALFFYGALFWVVLTRNFNNRTSRFFALYLVTMLVWSFGSFMIFAGFKNSNILFWNRLMVVGSTAMPIVFFGFVQSFLMQDRNRWLNFGYFIYAVMQIANVFGWVILDAHVANDQLTNQYGTAVILVSFAWVFFIGYSALILLQEYRKSVIFQVKNRIKYLLTAILVIFVGSLTNATQLQSFPVDITFNIASALLIAYAIFRYQLLDINIVIRKSLLYSIPTMLIGACYFLIIYIATRLLDVVSRTGIFILSLIVAVLTALVVRPLQDRAQFWIDRLFYREKYDANLMLRRLSETISSVLDLSKLTQIILAEVTSTLHIHHAGFFLKLGDSEEFVLMAQKDMPVAHLRLNKMHPLVQHFKLNTQPMTRFEIEVMPQFQALWNLEREELEKMRIDLFLPLKSKGELVGIFAVGPKHSGLPFTQDDHLVLTSLATQVATTIENALLFEAEARRRQEAETLQAVLSQLTSDLDLELVLDNILINLDAVIPYNSACVFLLQKDRLIAVAGRGFTDPEKVIGQDYPVEGDELFAEMQNTRSPLLIPDVQTSFKFLGYGGTQDIKSWMGVPLIARGTVIGCLTLDSYKEGAYSDVEQANLAQAFASHASIAIENARLFRVEREQRQLAEALREIGAVLSTTLDFDNVLDLLLDQLGRVVPYSIANIMLVENGKIRAARTRFHESISPEAAQLLKTSPFSIAPTPNLYYLVDTAQPLVIPVVPPNASWIESPVPVRSWLGAPIIIKSKVIACFSLCSLQPDVYRSRHAELLSGFAGQAALALQNARLFAEIQQLAITDDLTGIYNRRHLFELGEREFNRAQRYGRPLSVVMLDLDHFKRINDTYGHNVGDQVLRIVAERCKTNIREVDILGRYGGEEFTIILPEAGAEEAHSISERLRKHISRMPIPTSAGQINITVSLGTASLSGEILNLTKLIDCADIAMYEAKRKGRNFVCVYDEVNT